MAGEIKLVIPSRGRATNVTTKDYIANCIICVSEKDKAVYKEHNPDTEVVAHPDNVSVLGLKRQWIYNHFGDVFQVDDDLYGVTKLYAKKGEKSSTTPEEAYQIIQNVGNLARLSGAYLFGFNNFVRPEHYHGFKPFSMTGYINGCGLGMLKGAKLLQFDPAIKTNNDFFICGLNAFHYRKCFIDNRFCMSQKSFADNTGGCAEIRTNQVEEDDFNLLKKYFGAAITQKNNGAQRAKHKFSKTLKIPF